ncbi:MAG: hypothetical protein GY778_29955 [bacterium]|nr:hypothetical protein [bacterium]
MQLERLTEGDIDQHIVIYGMDVYPPIDLSAERTRLNMFYEEATRRWPMLYDGLTASSSEFKISAKFRQHVVPNAPSTQMDTFSIVPRGPVFRFPLQFPDPIGATELHDQHRDRFNEISKLFFDAVPDKQVMKIGLVRDILFATGQVRCEELLEHRATFAEAKLAGVKHSLLYADSHCNHRIESEAVATHQTHRLPLGAEVRKQTGYGLHVTVDVNNRQVRPLSSTEQEEVLDRADSIWPDKVLEFLNERSNG